VVGRCPGERQRSPRVDSARARAIRGLAREWRSADRIELELPLVRALESVDALHPDVVALRSGPLVLMRMVDENGANPMTRQNLLSAQRDPTTRVHAGFDGSGSVTLRAFPDIRAEDYSAYQQVLPS